MAICEKNPIASLCHQIFTQALQDEALQPKRLWLACSGGLDSMLLLELLSLWQQELKTLPIEVLHVNYGLRAEESDGDERFVEAAAQARGFPCHVLRVRPGEQPESGIQEWARDLRYAWFQTLAGPDDLVLLAHHADDLVETILMRLARGSGLGALQGMQAFRGQLWRPLLRFRREFLEELVKQQNIVHREDSSNAKIDYSRNRIRHIVLPELESLFPGVRKNLLELASASQDWLAAFEAHPASQRPPTDGKAWIELNKAPACQVLIACMRREWGEKVPIHRAFVEQVYRALCREEQAVFQLDPSKQVCVERGSFRLEELSLPISARWKQYRQALLASEGQALLGKDSLLKTRSVLDSEGTSRDNGD